MGKEGKVIPFPGLAERAEAIQREGLEKYGFYIHYVPAAGAGILANIHTHGLPETMGHADLQLVLPLPQQEAARVLHTIVDEIRSGRKFKVGDLFDKVYTDCDVAFRETKESGRPVLRVIIPDMHNRWPDDPLCADVYNRQYEEINI